MFNTKRLIIQTAVFTLLVCWVLALRPLPTFAQASVILDRDDPSLVTYYTHDGEIGVGRDPQLAGSTITVHSVDNNFLGLADLPTETTDGRPAVVTNRSV